MVQPRRPPTQRLYRLLLRLLPADFRAEFGREMEAVFAEERAAAARQPWRVVQLWARTVNGMLTTAPRQHADVLAQDLTYAGRMLARTPIFTLTAVLALALGIGGTCAVITLVDQVVLRQLPVTAPDRLVYFDSPSFSYPVLREVQRQVPSLDGVFGWNIERLHVTLSGSPEAVDVLQATGGIHQTLGIVPATGRLLRPADDREAVAVLSYEAWQRRFGGDPGVVGRTVLVEHTPVAIVGVTPRGFFGVAPGLAPELTIPAALAARLRPEDANILDEIQASWLHIMGRVKPGMSVAEADAALQATWPRVLETATPERVTAQDRDRLVNRQTKLMAADTGFSRVRRRFQEPLWLLTALVGLLMAVGCGTMANMMLSRTLARRHELSLRRAIGAGRGRLLRQLLTESLLLTSTAAGIGIVLGIAGSNALVSLLSTSESLITVDATPSLPTIGVAAGLALAMSIAMTASSAMCALRAEAGDALRAAPRSGGANVAERRMSALLVSVQVALSLTLVVGAGVFALNLYRLVTLPVGMERTNLLVVQADAVFAGHTGERLPLYYDAALARVRALPGVLSASYSRKPPVSSSEGSWWIEVAVDDRPPEARANRHYFNAVSDDYFSATGMQLHAGRSFNRQDVDGSLPVVIVNARLVDRLFGAVSPLGHTLSIKTGDEWRPLTIVGVVGNAPYQFVNEEGRSVAYLPYRQAAGMLENRNLTFEIRTGIAPALAVAAVRDALHGQDSRVPVQVETLDSRIAESLVQERTLALLASAIGATALLLAGAALYGLIAYAATARTREFGVRIALGATPAVIRRLVLRYAAAITVVGVIAGLGLTLLLGRFARALLTAITPGDPMALTAGVAMVAVVAVAAALGPALRSSRVSPTDALRVE